MKQLSCHVLDTANGKPAAGIQVQLFSLNDQMCLAEATTDQDGRAKFPELILKNRVIRCAFLSHLIVMRSLVALSFLL